MSSLPAPWVRVARRRLRASLRAPRGRPFRSSRSAAGGAAARRAPPLSSAALPPAAAAPAAAFRAPSLRGFPLIGQAGGQIGPPACPPCAPSGLVRQARAAPRGGGRLVGVSRGQSWSVLPASHSRGGGPLPPCPRSGWVAVYHHFCRRGACVWLWGIASAPPSRGRVRAAPVKNSGVFPCLSRRLRAVTLRPPAPLLRVSCLPRVCVFPSPSACAPPPVGAGLAVVCTGAFVVVAAVDGLSAVCCPILGACSSAARATSWGAGAAVVQWVKCY